MHFQSARCKPDFNSFAFQLSAHYGAEVDIDFPDKDPNYEDQQRFIRDHMKGGVHDEKPAIVESCLYTVGVCNDV